MKYFLDTEFIEGTQRTFFDKTKPTIDLDKPIQENDTFFEEDTVSH